jgi:hypothetical protein
MTDSEKKLLKEFSAFIMDFVVKGNDQDKEDAERKLKFWIKQRELSMSSDAKWITK